MIFSLSQILGWLIQYKYIVLFPIMVFEGPIITILAGFLSSLGYLNIFIAYGIVVMGDIVGDSLYYAAGRWSKQFIFTRWGRYIGVTTERMTLLRRFFARHRAVRDSESRRASRGSGVP